MKVTFVSNYINHHQMPFCGEMYQHLGEDFCFVQAEPMEEERVKMGWGAELSALPYLRLYYEQEAECKELIADSDVVLFGGVDDESYIVDRLQAGKLVVRITERIYKSGQWKAISPRGLRKKYIDHVQYRKAPVYLLCSGGYVASDFGLIKAYPGKKFKWGYFPETKEYDIDALMADKKKKREESGKVSLLWAGRFIDWKHPEYAIRLAERLKKEGYAFSLTMIGGGDLDETLRGMVRDLDLEDVVTFAGFQNPSAVRGYMEQADIYLFTSDYLEGWGAVLNESMNSGCAVVANCGIGAVPFLVKPGQNGLIYPNKNFEVFYGHDTKLIQDEDMMVRLGRSAYETIAKDWNAKQAASRLIVLLDHLMKDEIIFEEKDILSKAEEISPVRMYRYLTEKR